jgi:hypothetical protein
MIEYDRPPANNEDLLVAYLIKSFKHSPLPEHPIRVMVAHNQVDMSIKPPRFQAPVPFLHIAKAKVPEMINMVIGFDNRVPIRYKSLVHLLH